MGFPVMAISACYAGPLLSRLLLLLLFLKKKKEGISIGTDHLPFFFFS
jgi:hypothetical protein